MKILVTKMPQAPKECLFATKEKKYDFIDRGTIKPIYQYFCSINGKLCNLYCNEKCNKLKSLEKLLKDAYENYNKK